MKREQTRGSLQRPPSDCSVQPNLTLTALGHVGFLHSFFSTSTNNISFFLSLKHIMPAWEKRKKKKLPWACRTQEPFLRGHITAFGHQSPGISQLHLCLPLLRSRHAHKALLPSPHRGPEVSLFFPWRRKQTEQAPSWKQDSTLGRTVDFELYAQYLRKRHTNWKTRPPGWKSPRALHHLKEYPNYLCNWIESYILLCLLEYDHGPTDNCPLLTT